MDAEDEAQEAPRGEAAAALNKVTDLVGAAAAPPLTPPTPPRRSTPELLDALPLSYLK